MAFSNLQQTHNSTMQKLLCSMNLTVGIELVRLASRPRSVQQNNLIHCLSKRMKIITVLCLLSKYKSITLCQNHPFLKNNKPKLRIIPTSLRRTKDINMTAVSLKRQFLMACRIQMASHIILSQTLRLMP